MIGFRCQQKDLETPPKTLGKPRFVKHVAEEQGPKDLEEERSKVVLTRSGTESELWFTDSDLKEDDVLHVEDCANLSTCSRCLYLRNQEEWEKHTRIKYLNTTWLAPKITDGVWGLGCVICSAAGFTSDFANFTVRTYVHKGNLKRHNVSAQHQEALNMLGMDNTETNKKLTPTMDEFKQVLDHRRGVTSLSLPLKSIGRRWKLQKMQWCLAEGAREMMRDFLWEAGSVALSQDARGNKLLAPKPNVECPFQVSRSFMAKPLWIQSTSLLLGAHTTFVSML